MRIDRCRQAACTTIGIGGTTGNSSHAGEANAIRRNNRRADGHVVPSEQSTESAQLSDACQTLPVSGTSEIDSPDTLKTNDNSPESHAMTPITPQSNNTKSAEQSLQELVYAVSHDLGASARTIKGFADLLTRRYGESLDADGQNFLRLMAQGATDLQAQLDGLLAYSRVESRGLPLTPTNVAEVWQPVMAGAAARIRETAATVEQGPLPVVLADAKQLAPLLSELLANALKFRREEPLRVSLTAEQTDSSRTHSQTEWLFRFSDNGRGIAPQHVARIFQMFQRCSPGVPGVGAGLAIAQRIVQRHGGTIWAESAVGVGTTICFTLPGG